MAFFFSGTLDDGGCLGPIFAVTERDAVPAVSAMVTDFKSQLSIFFRTKGQAMTDEPAG